MGKKVEEASEAGMETVLTVSSVDVIAASVSRRQRDISKPASLALEISLKTAVNFSENAARAIVIAANGKYIYRSDLFASRNCY